MATLATLAHECAPHIAPQTIAAIVRVESSGNPYAIGVVGGHLKHQPSTQAEAVATAKALTHAGWNYSVGLTQVNQSNFARFGLSIDKAFDPCANLKAGASILSECYGRALQAKGGNQAEALKAALSCYYSGDFKTGQRAPQGQLSYVAKVLASADGVQPIQVVPNGKPNPAPRGTPEQARQRGPVLLQAEPANGTGKGEPAKSDALKPQQEAAETPNNSAIVF